MYFEESFTTWFVFPFVNKTTRKTGMIQARNQGGAFAPPEIFKTLHSNCIAIFENFVNDW